MPDPSRQGASPHLEGLVLQSTLFIATRGVAVCLALCLEYCLISFLGPSAFGRYSAAFSWLVTFTILANLGINTHLVRVLPSCLVVGDIDGARKEARWAARAMGVSGVTVGIVGGVILVTVLGGDDSSLGVWAWALMLLVPLQVASQHQQAVLQGYRRPNIAIVPGQIIRPVIMMAVIVLIGGRHFGSQDLVGVVSLVIGIAAAWVFARIMVVRSDATLNSVTFRNGGEQEAVPTPHDGLRLTIIMPLFWVALMELLQARLDPALLGIYVGDVEAGQAALSWRIAGLCSFGLIAVNAIAAPRFAALCREGRTDDIGSVLAATVVGAGSLALLLGLPIWIWAEELLAFFGESYVEGAPTLRLYTTALVILALPGSTLNALMMTGHASSAAVLLSIAAGAKLVMNLLLIPSMGSEGAALGTVTAAAIVAIGAAAIWLSMGRPGKPASSRGTRRTKE